MHQQRKPAARTLWIRLTALPGVVWLLLVFAVPTVALLTASFRSYDGPTFIGTFTVQNFAQLANSWFLGIALSTLLVSVAVAFVCVCLAYPVSHFLVRSKSRMRTIVLVIVVSPLVANVVVRTYGWIVLLDNGGIVQQILNYVGLLDGRLNLLGTKWAIGIGLTHVLLPFSVFTIMSALQGVDQSLERAARNLGAGPVRTFVRVTLPLSLTGVLTGFILTLAICLGAYATPAILGQGRTQMLATQVYDDMTTTLNWGRASAIAVVILVLGLVVISSVMWLTRMSRRHVQGQEAA